MSVPALGWLQDAWSGPARALQNQPEWGERAAPHRRLVTALAQKATGEADLGGPDLVVLLRAVLRYEALALGGVFSLTVPSDVVDWYYVRGTAVVNWFFYSNYATRAQAESNADWLNRIGYETDIRLIYNPGYSTSNLTFKLR